MKTETMPRPEGKRRPKNKGRERMGDMAKKRNRSYVRKVPGKLAETGV
jgi:hypothetical protein